jgi:preprotein translocase subunit SecB
MNNKKTKDKNDFFPAQYAESTPIELLAQYVKDLSFETPHSPQIFQDLRTTPPDIPVEIECETEELKENQHEVSIKLHIEATIGDKTVFILELVYAGVIKLGDLPKKHIKPMLMIETPRLLFPFARKIVADITVQGGFPPMMLQIVDFRDIYLKKYATDEERS